MTLNLFKIDNLNKITCHALSTKLPISIPKENVKTQITVKLIIV